MKTYLDVRRFCRPALLPFLTTALSMSAQSPTNIPRFEDYPVSASRDHAAAGVKLTTRSERMFRTNLRNAAKGPANFAANYRIVYWGCGSNCSAGAMVNLRTGDVFPLPPANPDGTGWERWIMCTARFEGTDDQFRPDSRLMIVRCGLNHSESLRKNVPDTYYFLWEGDHFLQLLRIQANRQ